MTTAAGHVQELLTVADVARRLRVSIDKVYVLIATGVPMKDGQALKLPAVNLSQGRRPTWRFNGADVERFLQSVRVNELAELPERPAPSLKLTRDWLA